MILRLTQKLLPKFNAVKLIKNSRMPDATFGLLTGMQDDWDQRINPAIMQRKTTEVCR